MKTVPRFRENKQALETQITTTSIREENLTLVERLRSYSIPEFELFLDRMYPPSWKPVKECSHSAVTVSNDHTVL